MGVVFGTTLGEERQVGDLNERWAQQGKDGIDAGFFRYLTKPVKVDELLSALEAAFMLRRGSLPAAP